MRNALFGLLFWVVRALRPKTRDRGGPRTVLLLQYAMPLGCCVHGTPIYAAIKRADPTAIVIVASRGLGFATLKHDPHIDHLIETPDPMASFVSLWTTARMLRRLLLSRDWQPDIVLQDASNRRGTYALFALLLRIAPTAGFANAAALYDRHLSYDPSLSLIDNNLRLVESSTHLEPAVYFTTSELERARTMLREVSPDGIPVVGFVVQGSGGQRTAWHDERFVAVIRQVQKLGYLPVFFGIAEDAAVIERIRGLAGLPGHSFAGQTSVAELAALLCLCDFVVTVDTGTMHVGRAVDVPMVVLGPSWQKPLEWLPLGKPNVRILRGADRADVPQDYRLDEIDVAAVFEALDELVELFPPSAGQREQRVEQRLSTTRA
jgi:ADP-heptose:LPS heptosyltransferase